MDPRFWAAAALVAAALSLAACASADEGVPTADVVFAVPWTVPEEAVYRIVDDGEVKGRGVLRIEAANETLRLSQEFEGQGFRDVAVAVVEERTLKPREVTRLIVGPDGERRWEVQYVGDVVKVHQQGGDDVRTDQLRLPPHSYDKWSEVFLWRTIDFRAGYQVAYTTIISADLAKPTRSQVVLKVIGREQVQVPAGSYEAWRLEIRQGGRGQTAWFAASDSRALLRYDNGFLVFELESLE